MPDLISVTDAARLILPRRGGKRVHASTIVRWAKRGIITLYRIGSIANRRGGPCGYRVSQTEIKAKFAVRVVQ